MQEIIKWAVVASAIVCASAAGAKVLTPGTKTSVELAGRTMSCPIQRYGNKLATIKVQKGDPSEGEAASGDTGIFLYQPMFSKAKPVVQLFIFAHECGHLQIDGGGTELRADVRAAKTGVEQGWLKTEADFQAVCDSWEDAPATSTHPAGETRCAHLKKWMTEYARRKAERDEREQPKVAPAPPKAQEAPAKRWSPWLFF